MHKGNTPTVGCGQEAGNRVREPAVTEVPWVQQQAEAVISCEVVHDHITSTEVSSGRQHVGGSILYSKMINNMQTGRNLTSI